MGGDYSTCVIYNPKYLIWSSQTTLFVSRTEVNAMRIRIGHFGLYANAHRGEGVRSEYSRNETLKHKIYRDKLNEVISEDFFKAEFKQIE